MQPVIIAIGSNMGDRLQHLRNAYQFLAGISRRNLRASAIYLTEPVGPSERYFLNGVIEIFTHSAPAGLLKTLQAFEESEGRPADHPKWAARTIDLDMIAYGNLVIQRENLIIPHPEYTCRLFVLKPLQELHPDWRDPQSGEPIGEMIHQAPPGQWKKTKLTWKNGKSV